MPKDPEIDRTAAFIRCLKDSGLCRSHCFGSRKTSGLQLSRARMFYPWLATKKASSYGLPSGGSPIRDPETAV